MARLAIILAVLFCVTAAAAQGYLLSDGARVRKTGDTMTGTLTSTSATSIDAAGVLTNSGVTHGGAIPWSDAAGLRSTLTSGSAIFESQTATGSGAAFEFYASGFGSYTGDNVFRFRTPNGTFLDIDNVGTMHTIGDINAGGTVSVTRLNTTTGVRTNTTAGQPSCTSGIRGLEWVIQGGAGVADERQVCDKSAADAYAWASIGGTPPSVGWTADANGTTSTANVGMGTASNSVFKSYVVQNNLSSPANAPMIVRNTNSSGVSGLAFLKYDELSWGGVVGYDNALDDVVLKALNFGTQISLVASNGTIGLFMVDSTKKINIPLALRIGDTLSPTEALEVTGNAVVSGTVEGSSGLKPAASAATITDTRTGSSTWTEADLAAGTCGESANRALTGLTTADVIICTRTSYGADTTFEAVINSAGNYRIRSCNAALVGSQNPGGWNCRSFK